jgi:hypothetical protein
MTTWSKRRWQLLLLSCLVVTLSWLAPNPLLGQTATDDHDDSWWLRPQRMIQTNMREIDARMDVDEYIATIKDYRPSVVLYNVGGIVANYPTELEYHFRNPHMEGDLVGTIVERLHGEGIRVIGRFDFSKINEKFAAQRPEWLYVSEKGENVNYNGQVHTCFNGGYQREYMFRILGEAVDRYPLDGVFFNMPGYQTRDYSGNHHGLCQSEACRKWFREYSGKELPARADRDDPVYRKYQEFCRATKDERFEQVRRFLKAKRPDLVICTYNRLGVDVIRAESNSRRGRGTYHDTEKAKRTLLDSGGRQLANAAVHFIAIPYRHAAVSPSLTGRRLLQHMFGGTWLDFYCIGPLHGQEDRQGLDVLHDVFRFHAANEQWLARSVEAAEVAVVPGGDEDDYWGVIQILSQSHVPYGLAHPAESKLDRYRLVVVPDAEDLSEADCAALDRYVLEGGKLLCCGKAPGALRSSGTKSLEKTHPRQRGAYMRIRPEDRSRLKKPALEAFDLCYVEGDVHHYQLAEEAEGLLRYIPVGMYGPPERCYYTEVSDTPGLIVSRHGRGRAALFPWQVGRHYREQGHQAHALLLAGAIDHVLDLERRLTVETSPLVEVGHRAAPDGRFEWVGLMNHTGHNEAAIHAPVPITDVKLRLRPLRPVRSVRLLKAGEEARFSAADGRVEVVVPKLDRYEVVLFELEKGS